jgi:glycosyltransferase involved in cell wall biosynthesis/GT2 family glycosyltransferase
VRALTRILMVHNYYLHPGGEDLAFEKEVDLLRSHGHSVEVYVRRNQELAEMNSVRAAATAIWSCQTQADLAGILSDFRPDLVHFHNTNHLVSPSGYYAVKEHGLPVVQTLHNYRLTCPAATHFRDGHVCQDCLGRRLPWPAVLYACYRENRAQSAVMAGLLAAHWAAGTWTRKVDAYIAVSEFMRAKLVAGGLPAEKIYVKPNFLADPGLGEEPRDRALYVGRLFEEKGLETLLRAWSQLEDIPLEILGSGPLQGKVSQWIEELSLKRVSARGHVPHTEVIQSLKRAKILIVPSLAFEGLPTTILEAFACGTPVVVSDLGALKEMADDGRLGAVFAPGDDHQLAKVVRALWGDKDELNRLGRAARQAYERDYSPEQNYQQLMAIYQTAKGGSGDRGSSLSVDKKHDDGAHSRPVSTAKSSVESGISALSLHAYALPLVTIGLVTWNSERYLPGCLEGIRAQTYKNLEVIVVDNASRDMSVDLTRQLYPESRILRNSINVGYCQAHNQIIEQAQGQFYLPLNPDVTMHAAFIERLAGVLGRHPECGSASGKSWLPGSDRDLRLDSTGLFIDRHRHQYLRGHGEPDHGQYDQAGEVFGADGAAPLYHRSTLEEARISEQVYDESYFGYHEDVDLAWRIRLLGWKSWYDPTATAVHDRSFKPGVRGPMPPYLRRLAVRNRYLTILKNEGVETWQRDWWQILSYDARILGYILLLEQSSLPAYPMLFAQRHHIRRWRQQIRERTKATAKEMLEWFDE